MNSISIIPVMLRLAAAWDHRYWVAVSVIDEIRSEGRYEPEAVVEARLEPYYLEADVALRLSRLYERRADRAIELDDARGAALDLAISLDVPVDRGEAFEIAYEQAMDDLEPSNWGFPEPEAPVDAHIVWNEWL